ncbi:MAG: Methylglutaconyl-CoA hydratase [uncultured Frankineae bacterium]|uniref:Methylglutaconyl-CoA hydratase n=1 Tax=uncultured Frankineae bacterium TaxID=437475 RepID=A0A6J4L704_9ACTN|nr:MAG: Methylglutaconyl-CoA hydratase [uncultured Frankineae bacterium]
MSDSPARVRSERRGPAAVVVLDSPGNRNALSRALLEQLRTAIADASADPSVRVLVLTGTGPVFCSGLDLREQAAGGGPGPVGLPEVLTALMEGPLPVVARVNGPARAGGVGLIAACDLAVGLADATFGFSEVRLGVAPAVIAVTCLRRMDRRAARELFLTGEPFDGVRAGQVGLLDRVVEAEQLDATVDGLVQSLALGGPQALAATRALLRELPGPSLAQDFARMAALSAERFGSAEGREGIAAFRARRSPSWVAAPDPASWS